MNLNRTINQQIMEIETHQKQLRQYENDIGILKNEIDIHVFFYYLFIYFALE